MTEVSDLGIYLRNYAVIPAFEFIGKRSLEFYIGMSI